MTVKEAKRFGYLPFYQALEFFTKKVPYLNLDNLELWLINRGPSGTCFDEKLQKNVPLYNTVLSNYEITELNSLQTSYDYV